jgi:hypothetical protein
VTYQRIGGSRTGGPDRTRRTPQKADCSSDLRRWSADCWAASCGLSMALSSHGLSTAERTDGSCAGAQKMGSETALRR